MLDYLTLASTRGLSQSYRTCLGIVGVLTCAASANLEAQAADTVPARLIVYSDTATLVIPDTVRRNHVFTVTVTGFAGGCIQEAGGSRVIIHGLVADITPLHVRRIRGDACTDDRLYLRQTVKVRFNRAGIGRIRFHGAANRLDFGGQPQWVLIERTVVVR